ncbi:hypothetical protein LTR64_001539 [Lithohypha guttulata]|uniref:uncharacterized protein n=1 Tax=Lithohypha guttulata TaxID=1690604 RepID=UPI002DDF44DF|nr:hypothetical protein LTR51_003732 [Lithohypha guttulata]
MASGTADVKLKVAVIQMKPKPLDPAHNFAHAKAELQRAADQGASLAVLPEYHLSGWEPNDPQFVEIAREAHKYQAAYQNLAKELKINICAGTIVQTAPTPASNGVGNTTTNDESKPVLLNISPFISYTGELLGTYTKTNIWIPERDHLTSSVAFAQTPTDTSTTSATQQQNQHSKDLQHAGIAHSEPSNPPTSPHDVIQTPLGNIGILICWDLAFPEAFRSLIRQECKLIIIPTYWTAFDLSDAGRKVNPDGEKLFLESMLVARAFENTCTIIFCNAGGPADEGFLGLSGVYAPIAGRLPGSFTDSEEGMRVVEVDLGIQEIAEQNYRIREDVLGEDWHYGYEKVGGNVGVGS